VVKQALVGGIPRVRCLLLKLKPKPLRSPPLSSYRLVVTWELILSPDPKGRFILLLLRARMGGDHAPIISASQHQRSGRGSAILRLSIGHVKCLKHAFVTHGKFQCIECYNQAILEEVRGWMLIPCLVCDTMFEGDRFLIGDL
jgi:hypothetical protein